jgi:hypothetical protein
MVTHFAALAGHNPLLTRIEEFLENCRMKVALRSWRSRRRSAQAFHFLHE